MNGSRLPTHGLARHPLQDPVGNRLEAVAEVEPLRVQVDDHIGFGRDGPVTAETGLTAAQRISQHHDRALLNRLPHVEGEGVAVDDQRH